MSTKAVYVFPVLEGAGPSRKAFSLRGDVPAAENEGAIGGPLRTAVRGAILAVPVSTTKVSLSREAASQAVPSIGADLRASSSANLIAAAPVGETKGDWPRTVCQDFMAGEVLLCRAARYLRGERSCGGYAMAGIQGELSGNATARLNGTHFGGKRIPSRLRRKHQCIRMMPRGRKDGF